MGSIIFYGSLAAATTLMLGLGAGYIPPVPQGEGVTVFSGMARPWVLPFLIAAGGLLSGLIIFLFGGIAKVPLAMILMVSEMTMDYTLLIPSMLTCSIAYFVTGNSYIFESQVDVRAESPAHRNEYSAMLLKAIKVKEAMIREVPTISSQSNIEDVASLLKRYEVHAVPVVDDGKLVGIVAKLDVVRGICGNRPDASVKEMMSSKLVVAHLDDSLFDAMNGMIVNRISQLPVVERDDPDRSSAC